MPIRKIADLPETPDRCTDSDHHLPFHIVLEPGIYEHTCPSCGKRTVFVTPSQSWRRQDDWFEPTKFKFEGVKTGRFDASKPNESNGYGPNGPWYIPANWDPAKLRTTSWMY